MELDLALLADAATIDGTGKLNILGVFDRITATQFPAQHGRVALVLRFSGGTADAGKHAVGIVLKGPEGREVVRLDGSMQIGPGNPRSGGGIRVPHVLNLDGLVFEAPGQYAFDVRVDGELSVSIPLFVSDGGGGTGRPAQA